MQVKLKITAYSRIERRKIDAGSIGTLQYYGTDTMGIRYAVVDFNGLIAYLNLQTFLLLDGEES